MNSFVLTFFNSRPLSTTSTSAYPISLVPTVTVTRYVHAEFRLS